MTFDQEADALTAEWQRRMDEIDEKYRGQPPGLNGPAASEHKELEVEIKRRFAQLRKKYDLE